MNKNKNKIKPIIGLIIFIILITCVICITYVKIHTFTLISKDNLKSEQIQPISKEIKVSGTNDTNVVFTDVENGNQYTIGYITPGISESIQLEKGKWYTVEGYGDITIKFVNIRID